MRLKSVLNFKMWLTGSDRNPYSLIKELLSKDGGSFMLERRNETSFVEYINYKKK